MTAITDFEIIRISPEHVSSVRGAEKLVEFLMVATNDVIYDKFKDCMVEYYKDMIDFNTGIIQIAHLKNDEQKRVVGMASFKLRFGGWRDADWEFVATARQTDLHTSIFATELGDAKPIAREFTGDPVLTGFKERLESDSREFSEIQEDILIMEPIYISPKYQDVEGLGQALVKPIMKQAITRNVKIIAYNLVHHHDYSHPGRISSLFEPLYRGLQVMIHVDTKETPHWKGPEVVWEHEFQLFGTEYGQRFHYPMEAMSELI
ncbi:hypothetical protein SCAR479_05675 [Seiridium cardinale]|uniref:Uncharacterized protein n=1 Tax=Seiridium cardinale TaxID=138064 RepID=A0ABR2XV18_9PEZI